MMGAKRWWDRLQYRIMLGVIVVLLSNLWYVEQAMRRTLNTELPRVELQTLQALTDQVRVDVTTTYARSGRLTTAGALPPGPVPLRAYDRQGALIEGNSPIPAGDTSEVVRRVLSSRNSTALVTNVGDARYGVVVTPIVHQGRVVGAVEAAQSLPPIDQIQLSIQSELAAISIVALASLVAFGVFLGHRFRAWLADVRRQTEAIARGEFERRIPVTSHDEMGEVGMCLNQMAEDLDHLAKARNEFLSKVSHELRTPLTIAKGFTSLLAHGKLLPEQERTVQVIDSQIDDLTRLVNDLLDLSRRQSTELSLAAEPVDMSAFVARVEEQQRPVLRQQHITLHLENKAGSTWVHGDRQRLDQVVTNLLGNAARYCRGTIWLRYEADERYARIAIRDNGPGIAIEDRARIFEPFFQARHGPAGRAGLGLTVARELVSAHGGTLEVDSELGVGTTFTIQLPRSFEIPKAAARYAALRSFGQRRTPASPRLAPEPLPVPATIHHPRSEG